MARYFLIHISGTGPSGPLDIYLTHNGMSNGRTCQTEIPEAEILLTASSGNTTVGNGGDPFTEKPLVSGKGRPFQIRFLKAIPKSLYDSLRTLIDYADEQAAELTFEATGDPGTIDVQFIPNHAPVPIGFTGNSNNSIRGVTIRGITAAVNP